MIPSLDAGTKSPSGWSTARTKLLPSSVYWLGRLPSSADFVGRTGWKCSSSAVTRHLNESWRIFAGVSSSSDPIECN